MFLNELIIKKWETIIRNISFKRGLNLITDSWNWDSWNSVWKTSLLRVVDYCLWSTWDDIYTDKEFWTIDETVFNFLDTDKVSFKLEVIIQGSKHILQRRFNSVIDLKVDDYSFDSIEKYKSYLNELIFGVSNDKPSLRQLMPKFIRKDIAKMGNIVKYLHTNVSWDGYMLVYFQLFHFREPDLILRKFLLNKQRKNINARITAIKWWQNKSSLKQAIKLIDTEIEEIENKIKEFDFIDAWKSITDELNLLQKNIYKIRNRKWEIELKISINKETLTFLEKEKSSIDLEAIKDIYATASSYIWELQKSFEEVVSFHGTMVTNKIEYIASQIGLLEEELRSLSRNLNDQEKQEWAILRKISNTGNYSDVWRLQLELWKKYELKWENKKVLDLIEELTEMKETTDTELDVCEKNIKLYIDELELNLSIFNKYFKEYSRIVYNKDYYIYFSDDYKKIQIWNIDSNVWWWDKKAYIALFDLAYIAYLNEIWSHYCKFIMHDSAEDTGSASLDKIFTISNSLGNNGQYIVSILREKILFKWLDFLKENIRLELSKENKFFKIESFTTNN